MADVVVRDLDDGRVLVVLPPDVAADVSNALIVVKETLAERKLALRSASSLLAERLKSTQRPARRARHAALPSSSVDELVAAGSLASMPIDEVSARSGLGRSRVYELRAAGVLRPAGRGRVLAVDVHLLCDRRA